MQRKITGWASSFQRLFTVTFRYTSPLACYLYSQLSTGYKDLSFMSMRLLTY